MQIQDVYNLIVESSIGRFSGAGIIFFDGQEVLMLKKQNGKWSFPGGKPIQGETPMQTAKRETKEEAGTHHGNLVKEIKLTNDDRTFYSFIHKINEKFTPTLSEEHKSYKWINYKKLRDLNLHKNVYINLKTYLRELKLVEVELS